MLEKIKDKVKKITGLSNEFIKLGCSLLVLLFVASVCAVVFFSCSSDTADTANATDIIVEDSPIIVVEETIVTEETVEITPTAVIEEIAVTEETTEIAPTVIAEETVVVVENIVKPGTYIIGVDIRPGLYRGNTGDDFCHWSRLSNLSGETSAIIAIEIPTGQYYIQVADNDFALETYCTIERIGD